MAPQSFSDHAPYIEVISYNGIAMMKQKILGIFAIALTLASTGAMARGATAIDMVVFSGALIEGRGYSAPIVAVVAPDHAAKAPVLPPINSKVSDQSSHGKTTAPAPSSGLGGAGPGPGQPHVTNAPEMDAASMGGALTLLIGAAAVLRGRRKVALGMPRA